MIRKLWLFTGSFLAAGFGAESIANGNHFVGGGSLTLAVFYLVIYAGIEFRAEGAKEP